MKPLPMILVREFAGLNDISYRIASSRARNYWQFLEHIHNTFKKPWERYNAHLHFENTVCDGRVSPSEWDAGGYFETELLVDERLVLYAHFEELESKKAKMREVISEDEDGWGWGWHGLRDEKDEWYAAKDGGDDDNRSEDWNKDPYPPFPTTLIDSDRTSSPDMNAVPAPAASETRALPTTIADFVLIDDGQSQRHLDQGIIIGRAKAHCCRDSNVRPVVRAILAKDSAVYAYMSGKYAKRTVKKGDVQIPMTEVDYIKEFSSISCTEKRQKAIKHAIKAKLASKQFDVIEPTLGITEKRDTSSGYMLKEHDCLIIGRAKPDICRDPENPPVVRAMLNAVGAVIPFMAGKESLKRCPSGRAQVSLEKIDFFEEFASIANWKRSTVIKEKILAKTNEVT